MFYNRKTSDSLFKDPINILQDFLNEYDSTKNSRKTMDLAQLFIAINVVDTIYKEELNQLSELSASDKERCRSIARFMGLIETAFETLDDLVSLANIFPLDVAACNAQLEIMRSNIQKVMVCTSRMSFLVDNAQSFFGSAACVTDVKVINVTDIIQDARI